jgi:hypothetical protein
MAWGGPALASDRGWGRAYDRGWRTCVPSEPRTDGRGRGVGPAGRGGACSRARVAWIGKVWPGVWEQLSGSAGPIRVAQGAHKRRINAL